MSDEARKPPITTTDSGIPAPSDEFSLTVGPGGPTVLHDHYVVQKMQHFNRERVPERVVHAKGSGAHGFFEGTEDVSQYTKADLFQPGKRTPLFVRFSTVAGELGSADTVRDPRGFAIKFYTEQGNYDLVGNNTPVFFVRDASKFQDFIHSQKRLPDTGMRSNDMQWDFWTLSPESAHQVTILMSDRGTPRTYRNMHGFSSHTFSWLNASGERFWVKFHFKTQQGHQHWTNAQASEVVGRTRESTQEDLFSAIEKGDFQGIVKKLWPEYLNDRNAAFPAVDDYGAGQLGMALDKLDDPETAIRLLSAHHAKGTDVLGILAGRLKRRWWLKSLQDDLDQSLRYYTDGYEKATSASPVDHDQAYYHGINVAYLTLASTSNYAKAREWAAKVLDHTKNAINPKLRKWVPATEADALIMSGSVADGLKKHQESAAQELEPWEALSMEEQAIRIADLSGVAKADIEKLGAWYEDRL